MVARLPGVVRRLGGAGENMASLVVLASAQVGRGGVGVGGGGGGRGTGGVEGVKVRAGEWERFGQVRVRGGSGWVLGGS